MADTPMPGAGDVLTTPIAAATPSVDDLQFQHAETVPGGTTLQGCAVCKRPISDVYFQAAGHIVCAGCAERIKLGTQAPPASALGRAALYGAGAALVGCIICATVTAITHMQIGLISILVGYMVGKAVRKGSGGRGGRAQQILAVALTYFAITTSYIPAFLQEISAHPNRHAATQAETGNPIPKAAPAALSVGVAIVMMVVIVAAAPFLGLAHGVGFLTLLIIFFGLSQAWKLTARANISIVGPYQMTTG